MKIILLIIILILIGVFLPTAFADNSTALICGTGVDDATIGTLTWTNPGNITANDGVYATVVINISTTQPESKSIKLVKGGVISGTDHATATQITSNLGFVSYGGSTDLWGLTLTPADINSSTFGAVWSAYGNAGGTGTPITHYLKGTNFGFNIPSNAVITGVLLEVNQKGDDAFPNPTISVDSFRMTITYTILTPVVGIYSMTKSSSHITIK